MKKFSVDYFRDEVRCGFYIPTAIKQAWAAGLTILAEIDRICEKYNILYFADWGTLLGAVRHGGYIPWDDDLDICMRREDYIRFREVADQELPSEFAIHDYARKENHWLFLSRVVNCNQINFEENHLNDYHNFPYIATVDIFIQDYLYEDEQKEKERCDEVKYIIAVADSIVEHGKIDATLDWQLRQIEAKYNVLYNRQLSGRDLGIQLYRLAECQMARVPAEESKMMGQIFPWILKGRKGLPKEYYQDSIRVPFENTTIPVSAYYHEVLTARYGNYVEIYKVWGGHDYPYFEGQRRNLQAVADFNLPEYSFTREMKEINELIYAGQWKTSKKEDWKYFAKQYLTTIEDIQKNIQASIKKEDWEQVLSILPESQQLVVDLGSFIEDIKGQHTEYVEQLVAMLSEYCNDLFAIYEDVTKENRLSNQEENLDKLDVQYQNIKETIDCICNRKEVLFLPTDGKNWSSLESIYQEYLKKDDVDIYVVPLPIFFKDVYGNIHTEKQDWMEQVKGKSYPEALLLTSYQEYNVMLHHPDTIIVQDPYDENNPCLTLPTQYYTRVLRNNTEELIFIPALVSDDFGENDFCEQYNLKHYVTAPGLIYANQIILPSAQLKTQYVNKLSLFAGEDTRKYWDKKIRIKEKIIQKYSGQRRNIAYCIGERLIRELGEECILQIQSKLNIFEQKKELLNIIFVIFPSNLESWKQQNSEKSEELLRMIKDYSQYDWFQYYDGDVRDLLGKIDAYYGDVTPLVPELVKRKIPVMIARYLW